MMITAIPFFIAGFFYSAWPWGIVIGSLLGLVPLITLPERYAHVWHERKVLYLQSALLTLVLSGAVHGGAMLLGNGARWLIGAS